MSCPENQESPMPKTKSSVLAVTLKVDIPVDPGSAAMARLAQQKKAARKEAEESGT
jgi:hypothetical protein